VIARNSAFTYKGRAVDVRQVGRELGVRYVLEGSVRRAADRVRITGQLVEAETGRHIWADRFDSELADVFALQDRVTEAVAGAIEPRLWGAEVERARRKPAGSLDAYDLYLRGLHRYFPLTPEGIDAALGLFRRALALDPDLAPAAALAAACHMIRHALDRDRPGEAAEAGRLARAALAAGADDPDALAAAAVVLAYPGFDRAAALAAAERALALNPNSGVAQHCAGCVWAMLCRPEKAVEHLGRALRLSPLGPDAALVHTALSLAHLVAGRAAEALAAAERALAERPGWITAHRNRVTALVLLGRRAEAAEAARRYREVAPGAARVLAEDTRRQFADPAFAEVRIRTLREAGLPE
jgi:adenylate cyclase